MAVVTLGSALVAIRGRVGDVVFKTYRDKIVVTRRPRFRPCPPTPAQQERRARLKAATAFAQQVYRCAAARAYYDAEAALQGRAGFRLAVSDHLRYGEGEGRPATNDAGRRLAIAAGMLERAAESAQRATPPPGLAAHRGSPLARAFMPHGENGRRTRGVRPGWRGEPAGSSCRATRMQGAIRREFLQVLATGPPRSSRRV